jgi:hypothetical protein
MKKINIRMLNYSFGIWLLAFMLTGCGNRFEEQMRLEHNSTKLNLSYLKTQLDDRQLTNALLIEKYANELIKIKPDYADIAGLLKKEATSKGKAYTALTKRLDAVNLVPENEEGASYGAQELKLINSAADVMEYNNSLADVVNTIASMSDGELSVINVPASKKAGAQQVNAMVGNPSYGNWRRGSDGRSFWEWYGMYSMFGNVFGRNRYYYDSWSSRPHYSYYNSYGRDRWGSSADVTRNHNLSQRNPSRYNKPTTASKARYAKASSRSSSYGGSKSGSSSKTASKSSRSSSYGSSSRSSSFSSSRSSRSGK